MASLLRFTTLWLMGFLTADGRPGPGRRLLAARGLMVPVQYRPRTSPRHVRSTSRATSARSSRTTASRATVPTTSQRKAGLRLDTREGMLAKLKIRQSGGRSGKARRERPDLPDRDR